MNPLLITCPKGFPCIYFLVALFYVVLAVFSHRLLRARLRTSFWTLSNVFFFLVFGYCVLRSLIMLVWPIVQSEPGKGGWIGVFDVPNLAFFFTYTTLLLVWAEFTWGARPKRVRILKTFSPRFLFSIVNAISFLGTPLLWIASADDSSSSLGGGLSTLFHFALNATGAIAFLIVGKTFRKLVLKSIRKSPVKNEKYMKKKSRQLWWFVFLGVVSFACLAVFQFVCGRVARELDWTKNIYLFLIIFKSELVLLACTIWMLDGMPPKLDKIIVPPPPPEPVKEEESKELKEVAILENEVEMKEVGEKQDEEVESLPAQIVAKSESDYQASEPLPVSHGVRQ